MSLEMEVIRAINKLKAHDSSWSRILARKLERALDEHQKKRGPAGQKGTVGWMGGEFDR